MQFQGCCKPLANPVQLDFVDTSIDRLEKQMGIHFAANQREAVKTAFKRQGDALDRWTGDGKNDDNYRHDPSL